MIKRISNLTPRDAQRQTTWSINWQKHKKKLQKKAKQDKKDSFL